jgi:hypothetical protein
MISQIMSSSVPNRISASSQDATAVRASPMPCAGLQMRDLIGT